jgi:hypothetical protein
MKINATGGEVVSWWQPLGVLYYREVGQGLILCICMYAPLVTPGGGTLAR